MRFVILNTQSGHSFGSFHADTPEHAIEAMMLDGSADPETKPTRDLEAYPLASGCPDLYAGDPWTLKDGEAIPVAL